MRNSEHRIFGHVRLPAHCGGVLHQEATLMHTLCNSHGRIRVHGGTCVRQRGPNNFSVKFMPPPQIFANNIINSAPWKNSSEKIPFSEILSLPEAIFWGKDTSRKFYRSKNQFFVWFFPNCTGFSANSYGSPKILPEHCPNCSNYSVRP